MSAISTHPTKLSAGDQSAPTRRAEPSIRNRILALLPPGELQAVLERSETVTVEIKECVWDRDQVIPFVHFPEDCVVSIVTELDDGDKVEAMTIGNDGFAGLALFHGLSSSRLKAFGQITGRSRRIAAGDFRRLMTENAGLHRLLHRYSQFVFETVSQSAACNRLHVIEQRCARWLLMSHDRIGRDRFDLTQEFLAEMLGVRRPGVTVAMGILEKAGLIAHGRGNITVVNRPGLEKASCECYRTIKDRQATLIA
ncbi:MAG: Crp/Fnr family transcriptional regulator [Gemmatimonadota bacterium]|nr:Crp/Fnr family transcriptional regulator [Gemmatimonadota bacterium]